MKTSPYFKSITGLKKAYLLNQNSSHLILTTSPVTAYGLTEQELFDLLQRNFLLLKRHLERYYNIPIKSYFRVTTNEGYGVIHVVVVAGYIPQYIVSQEWNEIHGSQIVHIRSISHDRLSHGRVSHYFTSQYLKDQKKATITRYGMSKNWVYPHFVRDWCEIKEQCKDYSKPIGAVFGHAFFKVDIEKAINLWNVKLQLYCGIKPDKIINNPYVFTLSDITAPELEQYDKTVSFAYPIKKFTSQKRFKLGFNKMPKRLKHEIIKYTPLSNRINDKKLN